MSRYWMWRRSGNGGAGGDEDPPILDEFSQTNAVSFSAARLLRDGYSGSAFEVRETGGGTLAKIGFDSNGELDTDALLDHCGANDGFIRSWFDHGTKSIDLLQTTAGNQPQIVDSGSVITDANGVPTIDFLADRFMQTSGNPSVVSQPSTIFVVGKINTFTAGNENYAVDGDGSNGRQVVYARNNDSSGDPDEWAAFAGLPELSGGTVDMGRHIHDALVNGASSDRFVDGSSVVSGETGTDDMTGITVGARFSDAHHWAGLISEILIFDVNLGGDRSGVRSNINAFYQVF